MHELPGVCDLPPCFRRAAVELRFLVDGEPTVLVACRAHASWLSAYADEDAAVLILDEVPAEPPRLADHTTPDSDDATDEASWPFDEGYG